MPYQFDDCRNDVERTAHAIVADGGVIGSDIRHSEGTGMSACSSVGNGSDAAKVWMLETRRGTLPDYGQIGLG
jgi:hypothetical protein